jgi:hypothetical protein
MKHFMTIALFLILGAIVTLAVAWGLALWSVSEAKIELTDIPTPERWPRYLEACDWPPPRDAVRFDRIGPGATTIFVNGHSRYKTPTGERPYSRPPYVNLKIHQFGWPMRAAEWHSHDVSGVPRRVEATMRDAVADAAGLRVGVEPPSFIPVGKSYEPRRLPVLPTWPGFAVDPLLYALILWLIVAGPFVLRRLIRIKRGRCPKCGYDLRGAIPGAGGGGCPECGWNRQPEATA